MKAGEIHEMIRIIVEQEVNKQLPGLIAVALAEGFLKKVVAEAMGSRRDANSPNKAASLADRLAPADSFQAELEMRNEEEEPPEPLRNRDQGIYHQSPLIHTEPKKKKTNEVVSRLLVRGNPAMAEIFDGVQPISEAAQQGPVVPDALVDHYAAQADHMAELAGISEEVQRGPIPQSTDHKMRELEMRRRALDVRADGSRPAAAPAERHVTRRMPEPAPSLARSNDGTLFDPYAPVSFEPERG